MTVWRWLADVLVPPSSLRLEGRCRYHGTGTLLRRLLENGALT
jgi:hypothetical protein